MNSPSSIIRSSARLSAAASLAAVLLLGCGGTAPPDTGEDKRALDNPAGKAAQDQDAEKGAGRINFHYANKSTEARLDIDLGASDLYLEMSGAPTHKDEPAVDRAQQDRRAATPTKTEQPESIQPFEQKPQPRPQPQQPSGAQQPLHKDPSQPPEDMQQGNEDVTSKVLQGIRKAQELFYQKRYPEALQMVRQSLDAQPTAEGHALAGSICYMMSQNGLARRHWQEALRINPDMPAVVNMLERTRTPGGRGSPSPRPIVSRPAPKAAPASVMDAARSEPAEQAPFPEESEGETAPAAAPAPEFDKNGKMNLSGNPEETVAPQTPPRPSARHVSASPAAAPVPAPVPTAPPAAAPKSKFFPGKTAPAAKAPEPTPADDEDDAAASTTAPSPAPAAAPASEDESAPEEKSVPAPAVAPAGKAAVKPAAPAPTTAAASAAKAADTTKVAKPVAAPAKKAKGK